jgi:hypothetical protein
VQALRAISAYRLTIPALTVRMSTERNEVGRVWSIATVNGETTYQLKTPDAVSIDVGDTVTTPRYLYDGKSVTLFDPGSGYYSVFKAAATIDRMAAKPPDLERGRSTWGGDPCSRLI